MAIAPVPSAKHRFPYALELIALAALYVATARFGLRLNAVSGFATLVWPPSGIALAALLLFGNRLWPGVLAGAIIANLLTGAPAPVALGIGIGNTLEAVAGAYALGLLPGFRRSLDRVPDVVALILFAAVASTMISATIGVTSLMFGGIVGPPRMGETWRAWWLGDLIGDLIVAPVLLVWSQRPLVRSDVRRVVEASVLAASIVTVSAVVFGRPASSVWAFGELYLLFPLLIWGALRFGQRGAVATVFAISFLAVWGTVLGYGPFARPMLYERLLALQIFMGVTAATFLVLGASAMERQRAIDTLELAFGEQKELFDVAVKANRAKSQFLAVMSHELRTPLTAIAGYADLLMIGVHGSLTEKQQDYMARIQRNEEHLLGLIEEVLDFAKIEAGQVALDIHGVRVHDALAAVEVLVEPELAKKSVIFTRQALDPSLGVRADPSRLRQILLNLVTNAIKFTNTNGVITIGADRVAASRSGNALQSSGSTVEIWVRDTGIGIPAEQLERVLEPFVQVESGPTRRYSGTGLGLAIARDLARAMQGDLRLQSVLGHGTTATLVLPAASL
jgi:signal transduction histidine kinase